MNADTNFIKCNKVFNLLAKYYVFFSHHINMSVYAKIRLCLNVVGRIKVGFGDAEWMDSVM